MRCPKCHYLSFEIEPRCRNCGHSLELDGLDITLHPEAEGKAVDLVLLPPEPLAPVRPIEVDEPDTSPAVRRADPPAGPFDAPMARGGDDHGKMRSARSERRASAAPTPVARRREVPRSAPPAPPTTELPLFMKGLSEPEQGADEIDVPLVKVPAAPRSPLAVRMKAPDTAGHATRGSQVDVDKKEDGAFERDLLDALSRLETLEGRQAAARARSAARAESHGERPAPFTRLLAATIDALLLAVTLGVVLWITLRWCELSIADFAILPILPTGAFLILIVIAYLLLFTAAGGQTIGKMLMHLRVVSDEDDAALTVGQAFTRACAAVPSVGALGAGFVPGLIGEQRTVHDRVAGTRVVRA